MLFSPKISPFDSNTMLTICDMGGVYISYNQGQSWERRNLQGTCYSAYFDEQQEGVIYVGGSGLYRSEDNGKSFKLIFPKEETIIETPHKYECGMKYYFTTDDYPSEKVVKSILVDPEDSNHIYILMYYYKQGIIYESKDNGENFEPIVTFNKDKYKYNIIYDYNELFIHKGILRYAIQDGIYEYKTEEKKVKNVYISETEIVDVAQVVEDGEVYYVLIEKAEQPKAKTKLRYTKDFVTYTDLTQNVIEDLPKSFDTYFGYENVEFDWTFKHIEATSLENIYLTQGSYATNSDYPYGIEGIIKYDGGKFSWLYGNPFKTKSNIENVAWSDDSYSMYGITVDPKDEDAFLFTTLCGVYYSPDSQKIYQKYSNVYRDNDKVEYSSTGINVQNTYGVEHDPFNKSHIMLLNTDLGLITSNNNGETWTRANKGIKQSWTNTVYDLEFDKQKQGVVYSVWSSRHNAPYDIYQNETDNNYGGFAISYDGGENWDSTYSSGLPTNVTPVKMSIVYDKDNSERTIYLATFNEGFFVSYDSGKHFEPMNEGIEKITYNKDANTKYKYIFGADIEVTDGKIFALTGKSDYNNKVQEGKVYEWINGSWNEIELPNNTICPRDLYYKNGVLYISATATYIFDYKTPGVEFSNYGGGIYTYIDGKVEQIYDEKISIAGVQIDSNGNMYASDIFGNIYLKNEEFNFKKIYSNYYWISKGIILQDDETIYLPTFGGGLLRIKISYSQ